MNKVPSGLAETLHSPSYYQPMTKLLLSFALAASLGAQTNLSLRPSAWKLSTNSSKLWHLYTCNGGALCFDFPTKWPQTVNYLTAHVQPFGAATTAQASLQVITTGNPVFVGTDTCNFPAHFRLYFEADSAVWTNFDGDGFRWWSNPISYQLAAGSAILTVPLTPDQWSTVYGKFGNYDTNYMAGFAASLQHTAIAGGTFGAGCNFGHGVDVTGGTAQFQLLSYSVF